MQLQKHVAQDYEYMYLLDTKNRVNLETYFKFKNKNDYLFTPEQAYEFEENIYNHLIEHIEPQVLIVYPQTSNILFLNLVDKFKNNKQQLSKNTPEQILHILNEQQMMKAEKEKLFKTLESHNTVKMAHIAGNQRKRFINCLFQPICISSNAVFLDDSVFSGHTLAAAHQAIQLDSQKHTIKSIALFSK